MPATSTVALLLIAAFLLGSIPFGFLLYRLRTGGDIRQSGSGNIGATNVARTAGPKLGILTLLLDAAKGWFAVWIALHWAPTRPDVVAAALLLVVVGHVFSPWLHFRGGKGVATGLGAFLALAPVPLLITLAIFAAVLAASRYVSLASICACIALPLIYLLPTPRSVPMDGAVIAVAILIISRHRGNIDRLRQGTEHKLGAKAAAKA